MFELSLTCPCYLQTSNTGHISHMIQRASRPDNHTRAGPYKTKTKLPNILNSKKYCVNENSYFTNNGSFSLSNIGKETFEHINVNILS